MGRASLQDVKGRAQVRTYHYPYTYTFYSIEHFLDHYSLDVRLSDIATGHIIAHFDRDVSLMGSRKGYLKFDIEPKEEVTQVKMVSSFYNVIEDGQLYVARAKVLKRLQAWLDNERTMYVPAYPGDIPRFTDETRGRLLMERRTRLSPPNTVPLARYMSGLGALVMLTGFLIILAMGIMPAWTLALAILCGLPFVYVSMLIMEGRWRMGLSIYSTIGVLAGMLFLFLTLFVGVIFVLVPIAIIDEMIWEVRTWDHFYRDVDADEERNLGREEPPAFGGRWMREILNHLA